MLAPLLIAGLVAGAEPPAERCPPPDRPHLALATAEGRLVIALLPEAAPAAVARLIRLAEGPLFDAGIGDGSELFRGVGYYDGLELDQAFPGASLATALRPPAGAVLLETEIDAVALGLDRRLVADTAEAMQVWQLELFPAQAAASDEALEPTLRRWLEAWAADFSADFLIGVSRMEIEQALGHRYVEGLASQPLTRGAVALEPYDARRSTPRLLFVLKDLPHLDGRYMVIGRLVEGLELAERIAARPLTPTKAARNRPLDPLRILDAGVECRPSTIDPNQAKGAE